MYVIDVEVVWLILCGGLLLMGMCEFLVETKSDEDDVVDAAASETMVFEIMEEW